MYEPEKYVPEKEQAITFQMEKEKDGQRKSILELAQATSAVLTLTGSSVALLHPGQHCYKTIKGQMNNSL